jgi:glycosyltransferase involved in cell wall biosynthesis
MSRSGGRRVAMFVFNNGLHDQRVHKQAQALGRAGYQVRVYCFLTPGLPFREEREGYTLLREDQRSHAARLFDDRLLGPLRRQLGSAKPDPPPEAPETLVMPPDQTPQRPCAKPSRELPPEATASERDHWKYIARINRVWAERAAEWAPHLVQAHDLDALEAAVLVGRKLNIPVLYDTHELWSEQPFINSREAVAYWDGLEKTLIAEASAIMTINHPLAEILAERYGLSEVLALHNCQESQALAERPPNPQPIALYQGALVPHRGCEQLIAAAARLRHVRLAIRGFGSSKQALRQLDREQRVLWWDAVPGPEVVQAAAQADIGLIPFLPSCLNHYYSTPNKLFEYMAAGLAIAGSDIPEVSRFVSQYEVGGLFDPYSPSDIAETLDGIACSGQLEEMKQRARQACEQRWNWEREVQQYLSLVERLLSAGAVGSASAGPG